MSTHSLALTQPNFTFVATTPIRVTVPANRHAWIQYRVTNKSEVTRTLTMAPIPNVVQHTDDSSQCSNPFILAPNQSCLLTLFVNGATQKAEFIRWQTGFLLSDPALASRVSQQKACVGSEGPKDPKRLEPSETFNVFNKAIAVLEAASGEHCPGGIKTHMILSKNLLKTNENNALSGPEKISVALVDTIAELVASEQIKPFLMKQLKHCLPNVAACIALPPVKIIAAITSAMEPVIQKEFTKMASEVSKWHETHLAEPHPLSSHLDGLAEFLAFTKIINLPGEVPKALMAIDAHHVNHFLHEHFFDEIKKVIPVDFKKEIMTLDLTLTTQADGLEVPPQLVKTCPPDLSMPVLNNANMLHLSATPQGTGLDGARLGQFGLFTSGGPTDGLIGYFGLSAEDVHRPVETMIEEIKVAPAQAAGGSGGGGGAASVKTDEPMKTSPDKRDDTGNAAAFVLDSPPPELPKWSDNVYCNVQFLHPHPKPMTADELSACISKREIEWRKEPSYLKEYEGLDAVTVRARAVIARTPDSGKEHVSRQCAKGQVMVQDYIGENICALRKQMWCCLITAKPGNCLANCSSSRFFNTSIFEGMMAPKQRTF